MRRKQGAWHRSTTYHYLYIVREDTCRPHGLHISAYLPYDTPLTHNPTIHCHPLFTYKTMVYSLEAVQQSYFSGSTQLNLLWFKIVAAEIQDTLGVTECTRQK